MAEATTLATRKTGKAKRYADLRPHTARIIKMAEYPTHVNGAYLDDPDRIATMRGRPSPQA